MLKITIPETQEWDEEHEVFITSEGQQLCLEHSLVSLSKWEEKWHKYFIGNDSLTNEELVDYIRCMTITQNVDPEVYYAIDDKVMKEITDYINDPHTATWFKDSKNQKPNREVITSEIIYYWMIALQIPFECQKWHINKLLTLIRVCNEKNAPNKKRSRSEILSENRKLNEARKKMHHTHG